MRLSRPSSMNVSLALSMREEERGEKIKHIPCNLTLASTPANDNNGVYGTEKAVMVVEDDKAWDELGQSTGYCLMTGLIHFCRCFTQLFTFPL